MKKKQDRSFATQNTLRDGWAALEELSRGEYDLPLTTILRQSDESLAFRQIGRLVAVSIKHPFAESFPYDPDSPSNWARSRRCWEVEGPASVQTIRDHQAQFELLAHIALDWKRPVEFIAEFNIFHFFCRQLRPVICGEAKGLENAEKIAKDLQKAGSDVTLFSSNHLLGAASVTVATCLVDMVPLLSGHVPVVTGATLLAVCFGQRKLCKLLTNFEKSYDKKKDRFANEHFPRCGSVATSNKKPCANRVEMEGDKCWIHIDQD